MPKHKTGTREEWQAARDELLEREKELTRLNDELAQQRRELPWGPDREGVCSVPPMKPAAPSARR
jgi:predicted dithiol-disulfide oxidoreductase (DUF899 family)